MQSHYDVRFVRLLGARSEAAIRRMADPVVGLWPDLTLAYMNPGWFRFARSNGAGADFALRWAPGRSLLEAIPEGMREQYARIYAEALEEREPRHHDYECSGPATYRCFRMSLYPLQGGQGLVAVHTLQQSMPRGVPRPPARVEPGGGLSGVGGLRSQCAYCRRFMEPETGRWLWVPDWSRTRAADVTHGICPPCGNYHFLWRRGAARTG
jgi:hypothetical protein